MTWPAGKSKQYERAMPSGEVLCNIPQHKYYRVSQTCMEFEGSSLPIGQGV